jgi:glycosyltransferase involved in cell wall biosynthesis
MTIKQGHVSILLPIHNTGMHLRACLDSLLAQTYSDLEVIAIDDASTDDSYKILKAYRKVDKRLKISRNVKHYGLAITLNRALRQTRGQFVAFMHAQDTLTVSKIERQVNFLLKNAKTVAVGTQCQFFTKEQKRLGKTAFPTEHEAIVRTLINGQSMQYESVLINRFLLPKDLLSFTEQKYPMIYATVMAKLPQYGSLANIEQALYYRTKEENHMWLSFPSRLTSQLHLWWKARFMYDYTPSFQALLASIFKPSEFPTRATTART